MKRGASSNKLTLNRGIMRTPEQIEFQNAIEKVALSEINNTDPMNLPYLIESLLERCWKDDKDGFFRAYYDVINAEDEEDV